MSVKDKVLSILRRPRRLTLEEYAAKLAAKGLHPDGTQKLDPRPLAPPVGYKKHPSMVEIVRDMVRGERLRIAALEAGAETFEESEDFEVEDDYFLESPWVNDFDPPIRELVEAGRQEVQRKHQAAKQEAQKQAQKPVPPSDGPPPA